MRPSYLEIGAPDDARAHSFFADLFDWSFTPMENGGWFDSGEIKTGLHGGDDRPAIVVYFEVADIGAAVAKVDPSAAPRTTPRRRSRGSAGSRPTSCRRTSGSVCDRDGEASHRERSLLREKGDVRSCAAKRNVGETRDGIDGIIPFGRKSMAVVSVKAGENVGVAMIRDLRGAMERTGAEIGIFLTLTPPRGGMQAEAAAAGQHEEPGFAPVPRIQIVTIEEAMALRDRAAQIPARLGSVQKVAPRQKAAPQERLL